MKGSRGLRILCDPRQRCQLAYQRIDSKAYLRTDRRFRHTTANEQLAEIRNNARSLQTDTGPTQKPLVPAIEALRQRVQSSPWVQQVSSGPRVCMFSHLYLPHDMLLRVKSKQDPRPGNSSSKNIQSIDELERFSPYIGKSLYYPLNAGGVFATVNDVVLKRTMDEIGWVRDDFVEHASRVLRLRSLSCLHRAHVELLAHWKGAPKPLEIPKFGATVGSKPSRINVIRQEVYGRVLRQDALWGGRSPFIPLTKTQTSLFDVSTILPPGGLQCIIELPPPLEYAKFPVGVQPLSLSSELYAQKVWKLAAKLQGELVETSNSPEKDNPGTRVDFNVLSQLQPWEAFIVTGQPEPRDEPTVSIEALEKLCSWLPQLTPSSCIIPESSRKKSRKAKKKNIAAAEAASRSSQSSQQRECVPLKDSAQLRRHADVAYEYSLTRPGTSSAPSVDGSTTKTVPVYNACEIFGPAIASTVIPWLLSTSISLPEAPVEVQASEPRYIGMVSLPCTAEIAIQLHRVVCFQKL